MSTVDINTPDNRIMELVSTSDPKLTKYLGKKIRILTVAREYKNSWIDWKQSDTGKIIAEYNGMFAQFE